MVSLQRLQQKINGFFSEVEKVALLELVQQLFLADDDYRDIEQFSFEAVADLLLHGISLDTRKNIIASINPAAVHTEPDKQKIVLTVLIDAAIIDSDANIREAAMVAALARSYGLSYDELLEAAKEDMAFVFQQGLMHTHSEFMGLLQKEWFQQG